jgi:hypothetical protein
MTHSIKKLSLLTCSTALLIILNSCGSSTPTGANFTPIDIERGYITSEAEEGKVIPIEEGILEGMIPMVKFEYSGRIFELKKDRQDGFSHSVTVVHGRLASPEVFRYLVDNGSMNKTFDDGFVLNKKYFRSHIATFYIHSATDNLEKTIKSLQPGDTVRLKGDFVYLKTKNGVINTSLDPVEFKCKYIYLTEIATVDSIYN